MQKLVYVFVNDKGWYFGDRVSAGIQAREHSSGFFQPFQQAKLFSSIRAAEAYRKGIINTDVSDRMILMPIDITYSKQDIFKAILKHD